MARSLTVGALAGAVLGSLIVQLAFGRVSLVPVGVAALIGVMTVWTLLRGEPPTAR